MGIYYFDLKEREKVEEAEIVNGIVKKKKDRPTAETEIFLTTHFLLFGSEKVGGVGLFGAIPASMDSYSKTRSLGLLFAYRESDSKNIFYIGFGRISTSIMILSDGIEIDEPLPSDREEITYREKSVIGNIVMVSFKF